MKKSLGDLTEADAALQRSGTSGVVLSETDRQRFKKMANQLARELKANQFDHDPSGMIQPCAQSRTFLIR
ncbi:hypothetical protein [Rubripirellula obstinata]|uniref:hypothetical protein n=1 Tax=Rubripirellula obstinata TaxID=406547 RepID=UPI0008301E67|nr:hypothetical protein [Rubripirellula obstinata]